MFTNLVRDLSDANDAIIYRVPKLALPGRTQSPAGKASNSES